MQPVSKNELENKAKRHFRLEYRNRFNKTKTSKALLFLTLALAGVGFGLVVAPPLLLGGLAAGVKLAVGTMLSGLAVTTAAFVPLTAAINLSGKYENREIEKDIANGTLVERYKNEYIAGMALGLEQESNGFSAKAAELKTRANDLRAAFGLATTPAPEAAGPAAALPPPKAAVNGL